MQLTLVMSIFIFLKNAVNYEGKPYDYVTTGRTKRQIKEIAQIEREKWDKYYECLEMYKRERLRNISTFTYHAIFEGESAFLKCSLCIPPGVNYITWFFKKNINSTAQSIRFKRNMKRVNKTLEIYHVKTEQQGYYYCTFKDFKDDVNLLKIDSNFENDIKIDFGNDKNENESDVPVIIENTNFKIYTRWSPWTKCSMCDIEGFKRKIGKCYVKYFSYDSETSTNKSIEMAILKFFPAGMPCKLFPSIRQSIESNDLIKIKNGVILISKCNEKCSDEDTDSFSLPTMNKLLIHKKDNITISCQGDSISDRPLIWKIGENKQNLSFNSISENNKNINISSMDRVKLKNVSRLDSNVYSCWQMKKLIGIHHLSVVDVKHDLNLSYVTTIISISSVYIVLIKCLSSFIKIR